MSGITPLGFRAERVQVSFEGKRTRQDAQLLSVSAFKLSPWPGGAWPQAGAQPSSAALPLLAWPATELVSGPVVCKMRELVFQVLPGLTCSSTLETRSWDIGLVSGITDPSDLLCYYSLPPSYFSREPCPTSF